MIRSDFVFPVCPINDEGQNDFFRDKQSRFNDIITNDLVRTLTMFKYDGLPVDLHERDIELVYQTDGHGGLTYEENGITRLLKGTFAPPVNYLYENTGYRVVNPWCQKLDGLYRIVNLAPVDMGADHYSEGKECVIIRNDPLCMGLLPIFVKYAHLEIENNLTMFLADVNLRQILEIIAKDDNSAESAREFLRQLEAGSQGIILDEAFGEDGIKGNPLTIPANFMTQLVEYNQYIRASKMNDIGIDCNYNMKRERISDGEVDQNADMLRPLVDVMLEERKDGYNAFRDFTGGEVNIQVEFDSIWAKYNRPYSTPVTGDDISSDEADIPAEDVTETPEEETPEDVSRETLEPEETKEQGGDNVETNDSADETDTIAEVVEDIKEIVEAVADLATEEEINNDTEKQADETEGTGGEDKEEPDSE